MTVACVGDSFCEPGSPVPPAIAAVLGETTTSLGVRGISTHTAAARGYDLGGASLAVVVLGSNDSRPASVDDVRALDASLRAQGARVVWLCPPHAPAGSPVLGRAEAMAGVLASAGVTYVPPATAELGADGVHPTAAGARAMAVAAAPTLRGTVPTYVLGAGLAVALVLVLVALGAAVR